MSQLSEFAGNHTLLVLVLMISFFVLIFSELRRKATATTSISPTAAVSLINNDAIVIDVRGAESFSLGHIVNARSAPIDELDGKLDRLAEFKNKPVIAICQTGISSNKAVDKLRKAGFESVYGLKGGMTAWTQAGLPVVGSKKTKRKK